MSELMFSVCVPAYNRAKFLPSLLDSVMSQDFKSYEILICEDFSPQRSEIMKIVSEYQMRFPGKIRLILNDINLGYDGNIRKLGNEALGRFCFYLGNDDLMAPGALQAVSTVILENSQVTYVLKSYGWFFSRESILDEVIRYYNGDRLFEKGVEALRIGFRRAGVISGFIVSSSIARACSTDVYDGTLYYQMHIAAHATFAGSLYYLDRVLVHSRATEVPDFGNSEKEKGIYTPGRYTPEARLAMLSGVLRILHDFEKSVGTKCVRPVMNDYALHIYPYVKDQLNLPLLRFVAFYRSLARIGFGSYLSFHLTMCFGYTLGEKRCDAALMLLRRLRNWV